MISKFYYPSEVRFVSLVLGLIFSLASSATAQTNQANPQASQIQNATQPSGADTSSAELGDSSNLKSVPELYPGESNDFGTQQIVKEKAPRRKWFEVTTDWQATYNDNYLLTNFPSSTVSGGKLETTQMISTWDAAFAPDPIKAGNVSLMPRIGFRQSFWNYGIGTGQNSNFAVFDFDTQTIYGENRWDFGDGWGASMGADWTRLTSSYSDSEIYRQVGPRCGASKTFKFNDYNVLAVTLDNQYLFTEVPAQPSVFLDDNIYDRFNSTFGLSYVWSPVDRLFFTPFYRFTYSYYPKYEVASIAAKDQEDRSDFLHSLGITTTYRLNDFVSFRVMVSYDKRQTTYSNPNDALDSNVPEYSKFETGLGGGVTIRF